MHHPTYRITHTSRGALAGARNSSMGEMMKATQPLKLRCPMSTCKEGHNNTNILALICFVLYLTKIFLSKMCILHCLVLLNSVLFKPCLFR